MFYHQGMNLQVFQRGMQMVKVGNSVTIICNGLPIDEKRSNVRKVSYQEGVELAKSLSNIPFF